MNSRVLSNPRSSSPILLAMLIYLQRDGLESFALMLSIVVVAGFVQVGFILGQASLDRFVRVAEIASRSVKIEDE